MSEPTSDTTGSEASAEELERKAAWTRGLHSPLVPAGSESRRATTAQSSPIRAADGAFRTLADNVRDSAIFLLDPNGVITYWGEGARLLKWWTPQEAEGAHLRLLYPPGGSNDGTAEEHIETAVRAGEYVGEGQRVRRDGSAFWAAVALTALREADGTLIGFAKVTRDLTAQRAVEVALQQGAASERARAAAEAVSAAKSDFIATMSHEIRTPINAVLGYADLLATEVSGCLNAQQRGYVARISSSGQHLLGLVDDVLDLSRLEERRTELRTDVRTVREIVVASLELIEPQASRAGVTITDETSNRAAGLSYWADEVRVRQILVNVLANAVKFSQASKNESPQVTVNAGASMETPKGSQLPGKGPWVHIRVADSGPGIPADKLEEIFEPFVQVNRRSSNPVAGAGLGLTISRRLARLMGGDLTVESGLGAGSTFVLWLPTGPVESVLSGRT